MKLCVALDLPSKDECLALAGQLKGLDIWLKVGMRSYYRDGKDFVKELKDYGFKLFVDLKLYDNDIPSMIAKEGGFSEEYVRKHTDVLYTNRFQPLQ